MAIMVAQVFKRFFQISILTACFVSVLSRLNGWQPTITAVETLSRHSPFICFFHYFTGWNCPGCGMTRALLSFFAGDPSLSFYFHPIGPLAGLFICYLFLISWRKKPYWTPEKWVHPRWSVSIVLILIAWGFLRN